MKNLLLQRTTEEDAPPALDANSAAIRMQRDRNPPPSTPRWVKVFVIIVIILVLLVVIIHLTGNGFGHHMHMSRLEQGRQLL